MKHLIKKFYTFITLVMFSQTLSLAQSEPVNSLLGDISFVNKFGVHPDSATDEDLRINTHLEFVENLLRQKDISDLAVPLQQKRIYLLDLLHEYRTAGIFPRNFDYKNRRPCFIDKNGNICAVGYLIEQTAGRQAAEYINNKFKYEHVLEMNDNLVDDWISNSGLTKEECAMIQPDYGGTWYCYCAPKPKRDAYCYEKKNGNFGCKAYSGGGPFSIPTSAPGKGNQANTIYITTPASATMALSLEEAENFSLKIYDNTGKVIKVLADNKMPAGDKEFEWTLKGLNPGIYALRLQTPTTDQTSKLVIAK